MDSTFVYYYNNNKDNHNISVRERSFLLKITHRGFDGRARALEKNFGRKAVLMGQTCSGILLSCKRGHARGGSSEAVDGVNVAPMMEVSS